jgi:hypothetical protein
MNRHSVRLRPDGSTRGGSKSGIRLAPPSPHDSIRWATVTGPLEKQIENQFENQIEVNVTSYCASNWGQLQLGSAGPIHSVLTPGNEEFVA